MEMNNSNTSRSAAIFFASCLLAVGFVVPSGSSVALPPAVYDQTIMEDDFDWGYIDYSKWSSTAGAYVSSACSYESYPYALTFDSSSTRYAQTQYLDVSRGGVVEFDIRFGFGSSACRTPGATEGVNLEYSTDGGASWVLINTYVPPTPISMDADADFLDDLVNDLIDPSFLEPFIPAFGKPISPDLLDATASSSSLAAGAPFTHVTEMIPLAAQTPGTLFRWNQPSFNDWGGDNWAIDNVRFSQTSLTDPVVIPISGFEESYYQPPYAVTTPPVTVPEVCQVDLVCDDGVYVPPQSVSTPPVGPQTISTPPVGPQTVYTPPVDVPEACVLPVILKLICVGPFTIAPQTVGPTPPIGSQSVTTPPVQSETVTTPPVTVPAVCDAAGEACIGPITIPGQYLGTIPSLAMSVEFEDYTAVVDTRLGMMGSVGPIYEEIVIPNVTTIPISVCPNTCPVPLVPEASSQGGVRVFVQAGGDVLLDQTIPLNA